MKVEMQSLAEEGITAAIKGQVTRQLSKEKEKSGADTFSKKVSISCLAPRRRRCGEEKSFEP